MKLDDKLIDYLGVVKSPYESDDVDQVDMEHSAYIRYCGDCIIETIGTPECHIYLDLHWTEVIDESTDGDKTQFIHSCLRKMISRYNMRYLNALVNQEYIPADPGEELIDFILFVESDKWVDLFAKCFSYINPNLLNNTDKIKFFICSDYDNFVKKLVSYQRINSYLKNYFIYCNGDEGKDVLFNICKKDFAGLVVKQIELNKNPQSEKEENHVSNS